MGKRKEKPQGDTLQEAIWVRSQIEIFKRRRDVKIAKAHEDYEGEFSKLALSISDGALEVLAASGIGLPQQDSKLAVVCSATTSDPNADPAARVGALREEMRAEQLANPPVVLPDPTKGHGAGDEFGGTDDPMPAFLNTPVEPIGGLEVSRDTGKSRRV